MRMYCESVASPGTISRWFAAFAGVDKNALLGCSEVDITMIRGACSYSLPEAYLQVMREIGRSPRSISCLALNSLTSAFFTFPSVLRIPEAIDEVTENTELQNWRQRGLWPFWSWEVDDTHFLDLSLNRCDPPVFYLDAVEMKLEKAFSTFSEYMACRVIGIADSAGA